jgi:hypothetical protein
MSNKPHTEIAFEVEVDPDDGGLVAHWDDPAGGGITTQGDDLNELQAMVLDAVRCHFENGNIPERIRLHFVGDPVIATHEAAA